MFAILLPNSIDDKIPLRNLFRHVFRTHTSLSAKCVLGSVLDLYEHMVLWFNKQ